MIVQTGVFSQDGTGDIVWDSRSSVLPNQAGPATGKFLLLPEGRGWAIFKHWLGLLEGQAKYINIVPRHLLIIIVIFIFSWLSAFLMVLRTINPFVFDKWFLFVDSLILNKYYFTVMSEWRFS